MNNLYLIPANSKKMMLVFGLFNRFDMILLGIGIGISFIMLMVIPMDQFLMAILAILPASICGFLVIPIPNYHNIRTVIRNAWHFYTTRQKYVWKGWCFEHGERSKK